MTMPADPTPPRADDHQELEALLPCPFCGGEAELSNGRDDMWCVECQDCEGVMFHPERAGVIRWWNRRVAPPSAHVSVCGPVSAETADAIGKMISQAQANMAARRVAPEPVREAITRDEWLKRADEAIAKMTPEEVVEVQQRMAEAAAQATASLAGCEISRHDPRMHEPMTDFSWNRAQPEPVREAKPCAFCGMDPNWHDPKNPENQISDFQDRVRDRLCTLLGDHLGLSEHIDGGAEDSGDWRDFTLAEIDQAIGRIVDAIVDGTITFRAQSEPQQQGGEFSLERIDGTKDSYKLYAGRHQPIGDGFMVGHGLWLCTISDFDANGEQTRERIVAALNAAPAPAAGAGVTEAMTRAAVRRYRECMERAWSQEGAMHDALAAALAAAGK